MTHTQTIALLLDATRRSGVLYHVLPAATVAQLHSLRLAYLKARAAGDAHEQRRLAGEIAARCQEAR